MSYIILAILFMLSGFFMKFSDDFFDEKNDLIFATVLGILCAIASAAATLYSAEAAYIFLAIPIGNLIALKIDGIHHVITLILYIVICLVFGLPELNFVVLLICILSALTDEIGHEMIPKITENRFWNLFFEYRFVMKIAICLLAVSGVFNILIFVCFIMFELSYVTAGVVFEKNS
ncbi:hypothetical protein [Methanobrevibacter sp.]|uniref:hypothetical protein n=1 Tax=Methanobrevibacter sp. TaxID=66852 RepID=UPI00388D88E2